MTTNSSANPLARFFCDCTTYVSFTKERIDAVASFQKKIDDEWDLVENYGANPNDAAVETKCLIEQRDLFIQNIDQKAKAFFDNAKRLVIALSGFLNPKQKLMLYEWIEQSEEVRLQTWPPLKAMLKVEIESNNYTPPRKAGAPRLTYRPEAEVKAIKLRILGKSFEEIDAEFIHKELFRKPPQPSATIRGKPKKSKPGKRWETGDAERVWDAAYANGELRKSEQGKWEYHPPTPKVIFENIEN